MFDVAQIRDKIKVPAQFKKQYTAIVAAGMKVMFSEQTRNIMVQQLKSSPDIVKNIADGIAGLMAILYKQSKGLPAQVILPAALELLTHSIEYIQKTKMANLSPQQIGQATQATVYAVFQKFGVAPEQADKMLAAMAQQSAKPAAPAAPPPMGGLLNAPMQAPQGGM